jgi:hypothetical protein
VVAQALPGACQVCQRGCFAGAVPNPPPQAQAAFAVIEGELVVAEAGVGLAPPPVTAAAPPCLRLCENARRLARRLSESGRVGRGGRAG